MKVWFMGMIPKLSNGLLNGKVHCHYVLRKQVKCNVKSMLICIFVFKDCISLGEFVNT
jgi:hypothetical protein